MGVIGEPAITISLDIFSVRLWEGSDCLVAGLSCFICMFLHGFNIFCKAPHSYRYFDNEWKPRKCVVLFDRQTEKEQTYELWHTVAFGKCFTSTMSDWFLGQVAGVSNRITGRWNKWQPDNTLKMPLTTLAGWGGKKCIWLFFCFTDCLGDINARWDICLVSNKICLHRIWWVRLKETHPLIKKIFHVKMDFYPKGSSWTRGPEETGASEAAVYSPVRRVCRWQLALAAPLPCDFMKPANLAPRYCPPFNFKHLVKFAG